MVVIVNCTKNKKNNFKEITISGHSEYNQAGKDIVCSAISAITNGAVNFLLKEYPKVGTITYHNKELTITVKKENNAYQLCLCMMVYQLLNIFQHYPKYIKIFTSETE